MCLTTPGMIRSCCQRRFIFPTTSHRRTRVCRLSSTNVCQHTWDLSGRQDCKHYDDRGARVSIRGRVLRQGHEAHILPWLGRSDIPYLYQEGYARDERRSSCQRHPAGRPERFSLETRTGNNVCVWFCGAIVLVSTHEPRCRLTHSVVLNSITYSSKHFSSLLVGRSTTHTPSSCC